MIYSIALNTDTLQYAIIGMLAAIIIIAIVAFCVNMKHQVKVSFIMDNETGVYNQQGLNIYYKKKNKKFTNPSILVVELQTLGFIYENYPHKVKLMDSICNELCKGLDKVEVVGRVDFNKFILLLDDKDKSSIVSFAKEIELRLEELELENYGLYNYMPRFAVKENASYDKKNNVFYRALLIFDYSNNIDGNIYYDSENVTICIEKANRIAESMEEALQEKRLVSYIQPIINLEKGIVVGGEILCRWQDSSGNFVYQPQEFIPVFEKNGFIKKLEFEMISNACQLIQKCYNSGKRDIIISVNVSKMNYESKVFRNDLQNLILKYGISPSNLEIEIKDTTTMPNSNCIQALKQIGVRVALDNFGKDESSFQKISNNMFNTVKMDSFFFNGVPQSDDDKDLAKKSIKLLTKLNSRIVCLGVETMEIVDFIATVTHNIDIQGYAFKRPIPTLEFESYLLSNLNLKLPEVEQDIVKVEIPVEVESPRVATVSIKDAEYDAMKKQLDEMKEYIYSMKNTPTIVREDTSSKDMEIQMLKQELAYLRNNNNNYGNNNSRDFEVALLKHELESLRNEYNNKNLKDSEMESLKKEIQDLKDRNEKQARDYEMDSLKRDIEDVRKNQNTPTNTQDIDSIKRDLESIKSNNSNNQEIDIEKLINALKEENERTLSKYQEEHEKKINELAEQNAKQTEALKQSLENERKNIEAILADINKFDQTPSTVVLTQEQIEEEQKLADKNLVLNLDNIDDTNDDDLDEDDEEDVESEEIVEKPKLSLEELESIVKFYQEKYRDEWNEKAREELKDGYDNVVSGLKYYQNKIRHNLGEKLKDASEEQKRLYNIVKNEIMKYQNMQARLTNSYEHFHIKRKVFAKISLSKKKLKVYLALNPSEYSTSQFPHKDLSNKKVHSRTPFYTMVKSNLSVKRVKKLIGEIMNQNGIEINEEYTPVDYANKFKYYSKDNSDLEKVNQ